MPSHEFPPTPAVILYAEDAPRNDVRQGGANKRYRSPRLQVEERTLPAQPAAGLIRVRLDCVGICGTDLHLLETDRAGYTRCSGPALIPAEGRVLGHEGTGTVTAVGPGASGFTPGDVVSFESIITCKSCVKCRQGAFNQCEHSSLLGMEQDGLFATMADLPASAAHVVNDLARSAQDAEALACLEPAAVAYLACVNARIAPGETVAVLGAGPIGFFAALLARTVFGAARVILSEPMKFRREFASQAADEVMTPEEFAGARTGLDVLIDAAGCLTDTSAAIARMKGNGRIILLSRTGESLHIDLVDQIISKSLHLIGSRGHLGGAMNAVLSLARAQRLDLHAPITRVVRGIGELATALTRSDALLAGDCKVIARLS